MKGESRCDDVFEDFVVEPLPPPVLPPSAGQPAGS